MVDSPPRQTVDYNYVLAAFAKWCYVMKEAVFQRYAYPTMANLITIVLASGEVQVHCTPTGATSNFALSSSLPGPLGKFKDQARQIRQACLDKLFTKLPDAPRFMDAVNRGEKHGVNWGHCAETLSTICQYMNVEAPRNMGGLAVYTEVVGGYSTYKTEIVGKAQVRACENCKLMMRHAKIVYHDWYQRGWRPPRTKQQIF